MLMEKSFAFAFVFWFFWVKKVSIWLALPRSVLMRHVMFEGQNGPKFQALYSIIYISEILALILLNKFVLQLSVGTGHMMRGI